MEDQIPVVFAITNNYVKQLATVLISILKNSSINNTFNFYVLSCDISSENQDILKNFVKKNNKFSDITFIPMNDIIKNFDLEKLMSRREDYKYISIETYFRFFIPELFLQYKKIIYLDADVLVFDDIKELYEIDLQDTYIGAAQDTVLSVFIENINYTPKTMPKSSFLTYFKEKLHKKDTHYFNAGVLLMNLEKIRNDNMVEKLWDFALKESPLEYQDQDVLNAVFDEKVTYIDYKWNTLKDLNIFARLLFNKQTTKFLLEIYKHPGIFHYVGANKPWIVHNENYNYSFINEWWEYYQMTPYFRKDELFILTYSNHMQKIVKPKTYFSIIIFCFTLFSCYRENKFIKFKVLNFLKMHKRLKPLEIKDNKLSI